MSSSQSATSPDPIKAYALEQARSFARYLGVIMFCTAHLCQWISRCAAPRSIPVFEDVIWHIGCDSWYPGACISFTTASRDVDSFQYSGYCKLLPATVHRSCSGFGHYNATGLSPLFSWQRSLHAFWSPFTSTRVPWISITTGCAGIAWHLYSGIWNLLPATVDPVCSGVGHYNMAGLSPALGRCVQQSAER